MKLHITQPNTNEQLKAFTKVPEFHLAISNQNKEKRTYSHELWLKFWNANWIF